MELVLGQSSLCLHTALICSCCKHKLKFGRHSPNQLKRARHPSRGWSFTNAQGSMLRRGKPSNL
eukprot:631794-Amphidinium_carterae.1